jgi:hypothetical protein
MAGVEPASATGTFFEKYPRLIKNSSLWDTTFLLFTFCFEKLPSQFWWQGDKNLNRGIKTGLFFEKFRKIGLFLGTFFAFFAVFNPSKPLFPLSKFLPCKELSCGLYCCGTIWLNFSLLNL